MRTPPRREGTIWLPRPNAAAAIRLFCFPHAGGWSGSFNPLVECAPPDFEMALMEVPGRGTCSRDAAPKTIDDLVRTWGEAIARRLSDHSRCVFFGHSMGALLAFEVQHWLLEHVGRGADDLVASSARAPDVLVQNLEYSAHDLHHDDFLVRRLEAMGGTPDEVLAHEELREMVLALYRLDLSLLASYVHRERVPLAARVFALGGADDPFVPAQALDRWQLHANSPVTVDVFAGGHFYLYEQSAVVLARLRCLLTGEGAQTSP